TSSTHTAGTWSMNHNPYFTWSMPTANTNYQGVRYVLDHYANTVPTQVTGTFIPTTQQKLQLSNLDDGIWVLHMVTVDQQGYQTKAVAHYQAWIATATPMNGTANGQISWINGGTAQTIAGATVTFNRGLFTSTATASDGKYNLTNVPAGTWEATASAAGFNPVTKTVVVTGGMATTTDFQLTKM
ncbi:MAG: carboxypeptidase regulatory-like domain-containing protein, partial [Polyangia bacterium]